MRNNQPITNRETFMTDEMFIVSRTDLGGRITSMNKDFIDMSGFKEEELTGQPHNIIRHPDMPQEAFEDMWRDIKQGLPWTGYVKNRVKNGDHYWVQANAMPEISNGQITGYISIRKKPDPAIVNAADGAYKIFREEKSHNLAVEHGRVIHLGRKAKLQRWFECLGNRIVVMSTALCLMIALVGGVGIYVTENINQSFKTVYVDRVIPLGQLQSIESHYYDAVTKISAAAQTGTEINSVLERVAEDLSLVDKTWEAYMATYLTPDEKVLASQLASTMEEFREKVLDPATDLLKTNRLAEVSALLAASTAQLDQLRNINEKLIKLQLDVANAEYSKAVSSATIGFSIAVGVILLGLALTVLSSKSLRKRLHSRMGYLDSRLSSIAGGNYNTSIEPSHDELQSILSRVNALQLKLAFADIEKSEAEKEKVALQEKLASDFEQSVKGIVGLVAAAATELSQTASSMVSTIMESSQKTTEATSAATNTASNVQAVAAAAEELSASVREISSQVQKTTELVVQSQERTKNADNVASELARASERVTTAMQLISGIASQINLLALNATIESARAGEAGKGFAVVASEVKNLANQTDKTVNEIQAVVEEMRGASQAIITSLGEIGSSVGAITEASSSVASAVEEQSAVTNEIARNMQNASGGTQTISQNLVEVMASSTHAGSASEQMLMASRDLSTQAENLNTQVDDFLKRIRAS